MNFKLLAVYHPYAVEPNKLRVDLAIRMNLGEHDMDEGTVQVWIEPRDVKTATLAEIEDLAIARARALTAA